MLLTQNKDSTGWANKHSVEVSKHFQKQSHQQWHTNKINELKYYNLGIYWNTIDCTMYEIIAKRHIWWRRLGRWLGRYYCPVDPLSKPYLILLVFFPYKAYFGTIFANGPWNLIKNWVKKFIATTRPRGDITWRWCTFRIPVRRMG